MKLNALLAKAKHGSAVFKKQIAEVSNFFKNSQGSFQGYKKTYTPREGFPDLEKESAYVGVVTTVAEQLTYFEQVAAPYLNDILSIEATNATGAARADLIVGDIHFGKLSTYELLRLKTIVESGLLEGMYVRLPTRSDAEIWTPTKSEDYKSRDIYETPLQKGENRVGEIEKYILADPNLAHLGDGAKYIPQLGEKRTVTVWGDYTLQRFSGETTHHARAKILERRSKLLEAIEVALKKANDVEAVPSPVSADQILNYLHGNTP